MGRAFLLSLMLLFSSVAAGLAEQREIAGRYAIEGANPGGAGNYRGEVEVAPNGETYLVRWKIEGTEYRGTGILRDGTFSVIYQQPRAGAGIAVFTIKDNGSLAGVWTGFGARQVGSEVWNPRDKT